MVEDSVPTFQTFCEHQDIGTLAADQGLAKQYEDVVKSYATFAIKVPTTSKAPASAPIAIRWKAAGLEAIKSISSSEAVSADGGKQLSIILPVILETLYSDRDDQLLSLAQKATHEREAAVRRRMSVATARTSESVPDTNNAAISVTTADADRVAEEELGLAALQSLKSIFSASNRAQVRMATSNVLNFLTEMPTTPRPDTARTGKSVRSGSWRMTLIELLTKWTPVQDRFIIIVTVMETLVRSPMSEENLEKQLVLVNLVEWLLGSTINMIGLSVMDVLLGLIQHILLLLQLGGKASNVLPHHQQSDAIDLFRERGNSDNPVTTPEDELPRAYTPSATRQELLTRLKLCMANLATHIYYSDQVSDIISAILLRLKPSPISGITNGVTAVDRPAATARATAESVNMKEDASDSFFSFGTARVTALNAVKDVLTTANKKGAVVGAGALGRSRVGVQVWEGTQWLLRDEDRRVRRAYVDALLTWLNLEMDKKALRVMEDRRKSKKPKQTNGDTKNSIITTTTTATRAASNASNGKRSKLIRSSYLQLLHVAIYDNALESPGSDSDVLLMHLLLVSLVQKLGVNAVKSGLPMIIRLQEDINSSPLINAPKAKINVGSLVHGYLNCLSKMFEFDTTMAGYEIQSEMSRRQKAGLWLGSVQIPPLPLEQIIVGGRHFSEELSPDRAQHESLRPFDNLHSLVNQISSAYSSHVRSPPSSPPMSPGRGSAAPIMSPFTPRSTADELPVSFKDAMLAKWTRELCMATIEKESTRTASPHGSRTGTSRSAPNGLLAADDLTRDTSPAGAVPRSRTRDKNAPGLTPLTTQARHSSVQMSAPSTPVSSSDHTHTLRVDDLKRVLAGASLADAFAAYPTRSSARTASPLRSSSIAYQDFGTRTGRNIKRPSVISAGSDSIVDAEGFESASEGDLEHPLPTPQSPPSTTEVTQIRQQLGHRSYEQEHSTTSADREHRLTSRGSRARSGSEASAEDPEANAKALKGELFNQVVRGSIVGDEGVPPVPPLPEGLLGKSGMTKSSSDKNSTIKDGEKSERRDRSIGRNSEGNRSSVRSTGDRRTMVQALLGSIEVGDGLGRSVGKPPY